MSNARASAVVATASNPGSRRIAQCAKPKLPAALPRLVLIPDDTTRKILSGRPGPCSNVAKAARNSVAASSESPGSVRPTVKLIPRPFKIAVDMGRGYSCPNQTRFRLTEAQ